MINNIVGRTVADDGCNVEECTKSCKRQQSNSKGICQGKICTCDDPCDPKADMCTRMCITMGKGCCGHCDPKTLGCVCDHK